jgi:hypothetical protein
MKAHVTRALEGLSDACDALSVCARYDPSTGYIWKFVDDNDDDGDEEAMQYIQERKKRKQRRIIDNRRPGER